MRRRERLTGFLIIFILLTFSAYSNSMNVGGRMLQSNLQSDSEKQQNINNFQERNTATNRDFNKINSSTKQKEKTTMETKNKTENNNSDTADIQDNSDRKTEKI